MRFDQHRLAYEFYPKDTVIVPPQTRRVEYRISFEQDRAQQQLVRWLGLWLARLRPAII